MSTATEWWNTERVSAAKEILAGYPRICQAAVDEIGFKLGRPISYDALRGAFVRHNEGAPGSHCVSPLKGEIVEPVELAPVGVERVALLPDCHVPAHDKEAFTIALAGIRAFGADTLVILGDFADFASVSFHPKDPSKVERLTEEVEAVNRELDRVDALGIKRVVYCGANHEDRLARTIAQKVPELYGMLSIERLFRMKERGYEFVPYGSYGRVGKLHVTHDCGFTGATAAAKSRDAFGGNVAVGHCHNANISYRGSLRGEAHVGFSVGWLGDPKQISYMHKAAVRGWQHGYGQAYVERDTGNVHCHFVPIVGGRCVVEGKIVTKDGVLS